MNIKIQLQVLEHVCYNVLLISLLIIVHVDVLLAVHHPQIILLIGNHVHVYLYVHKMMYVNSMLIIIQEHVYLIVLLLIMVLIEILL